jgi:hypothetical protein
LRAHLIDVVVAGRSDFILKFVYIAFKFRHSRLVYGRSVRL